MTQSSDKPSSPPPDEATRRQLRAAFDAGFKRGVSYALNPQHVKAAYDAGFQRGVSYALGHEEFQTGEMWVETLNAEEDWIRIASQNAKDATARYERLAAENDKLRAELEIHRAAWTRDGAYEVAVDGYGLEDWELGETFIVGGKRYVVKSIKRATQPQPTLNVDPYIEAARQMNDATNLYPLPEPRKPMTFGD